MQTATDPVPDHLTGRSTPADDLQAMLAPTPSNETASLLGDQDVERGRPNNYGTSPPPQSARTSSRARMFKRVKYYVPATQWIPHYSFQSLGVDIVAGLTVASVLVPQSISYATSLARLSPVVGLFSASIPGIIYAMLGTSRQLNVAPEAALSLVVGQAVSDILHRTAPSPDPNEHDKIGLAVSTIITLQVGLITFILGMLRLGFIDVVLSRALLRGFIAAVAVVIMVEQLIPMLGLTPLYNALHPHSTLEKIAFLVENAWTHVHYTTTIISFSALAVLVALRWVKGVFRKYVWIYRLPEVLVVVIVSIILSDKFQWDEDGVDIVGNVPIHTGSHFLHFPINKRNVHYLRKTTSTAVLLSVVGFLDSIVSAKQNSGRFGYSISPNRELVALGAANIFGSFVPGTLPAYGSITRSRMNADIGATSQMASLVCSSVVLLFTFFLLPTMYYLPRCVLASIICLVVFSLLAEVPHDVAYYWKMEAWPDLTLMLLTFTFAVVWDVEAGIVVSVVISLLLVVHRASKMRMTIMGRIRGTRQWIPVSDDPDAEEDIPGALIVRIRENLDFANTAQLKERLRTLELYGHEPRHPSDDPRRPQATLLVFQMADVESCDASAVQIFYELLETYKNRGVSLFITNLRSGPRQLFERGGIVQLLGEDAFRENVADAIARAHPSMDQRS